MAEVICSVCWTDGALGGETKRAPPARLNWNSRGTRCTQAIAGRYSCASFASRRTT